MHEKAKCVCFIYMQPLKVKFKFVQLNMKHVSYCVQSISIHNFKVDILKFGVCKHLGMTECLAQFSGHCGLDLVSRISVSKHISYIT